MSFEEFNAALVRLNFVGVQREVRALFDRYDTDGSGFLAYEECVGGRASPRALVRRGKIRVARSTRESDNGSPPSPRSRPACLARVRALMDDARIRLILRRAGSRRVSSG